MSELNDYFRWKCFQGLKNKGLDTKPEYITRLNYELDVIISMNFAGYFLIVQHFVNWARNNGCLVGLGRGSAAGSLASYCLNITGLDPIEWGLFFERFLNIDRISMPDCDLDFEDRYRDKVIQYVSNWIGRDQVAHIGTYGKQRAKAAVRNVARTLGHPYTIGDELAKLLIGNIHGKPQPLKSSIQQVGKLAAYYQSNSPQGDILRWAEKIEDSISDVGTHASGIVISNESLLETVPLFVDKNDNLTSQWDMGAIEDVGLIKYDFLGLDALTKLHICVDLVKQTQGIDIDINHIDFQDEMTFENLRSGDVVGVFQLGTSSGMRDLLVQIRPTCLNDLAALVAIYRPGPLSSQGMQQYLAVRAGLQEPQYPIPELKPILEETNGWAIYQEQNMEIARKLCGYTGAQADSLRKAIGKKKPELMKEHEKKFKDGWKASGFPEDKGATIWEDINACASYQFCKSHAAAYGTLCYQTAFLKTHYPIEYLCACLQAKSDDQDEVIKLLAECRRLDIKINPPNINESELSFSIKNKETIEFGLGPIKNIGEQPILTLIEERKRRPFSSLRDFCERVDLGIINRKKLESLILAGACDCFDISRAAMHEAVDKIWTFREETKKYKSKLVTFQKKSDEYIAREEEIAAGKTNPKGQPLKSRKQPESPIEPQWPEILIKDEMPIQDLLKAERELLGFYITSHPLEALGYRGKKTIEWIKESGSDQERVEFVAVLSKKTEIVTKKQKKKMCYIGLEDLTGTIEGVLFPARYERVMELLETGTVLQIVGKIETTETETARLAKIDVEKVSRYSLQQGPITEKIDLAVTTRNIPAFLDLVQKYKGDIYTLRVTIKCQDGTKIYAPTKFKIGNYKKAIKEEVKALSNEY